MKNSAIFILAIFSIMILSGCTDKSEQTNVPANLMTDEEIKAIKVSENAENLFKEYTDDINNWKIIDREGDFRNNTDIQISEESVNIKEGSKSIRIDYINNATKRLNVMPSFGVDLIDQGQSEQKINLSTWREYNAVSFWLFQPNIDTKARIYVHLAKFEGGDNYSVYDVGKEFDGRVTGWSHVVIPFSRFKWAEWSTLHYPFDPSNLNILEISFDSDDPVQFTTYIDGFRPVKIE